MKVERYIEAVASKTTPWPMPDESLYLDYAATTPLLPQAREAMLEGFALWANPSRLISDGRPIS